MLITRSIISFVCIFLSNLSFSQIDLKWLSYLNSETAYASAITTDNQGNVFHVGNFLDQIDLDPSSNHLIAKSNGLSDFYVQKLSPSGKLLWAFSFGSIGLDEANQIAIDNNGDILIAGSFSGLMDFDPTQTSLSLVPDGTSDVFVLKLNSAGNLIWVKQFGGPINSLCSILSLTIDNSNNIYLGSVFSDSISFTTSSNYPETFKCSAGVNGLVIELSPNGDYIRGHHVSSNKNSTCLSVYVDSHNNVYLAGTFSGMTHFDYNGNSLFLSAPPNDYQGYFQKLDQNWSSILLKEIGGQGGDIINSIQTDSYSNIIISGSFLDSIDLDPDSAKVMAFSDSSENTFIAKYSSSGKFLWSNLIESSGLDNIQPLQIDMLGNIYFSGYSEGTFTFKFLDTTVALNSKGGTDFYYSKLSSQGQLIYFNRIGGSDYDFARDLHLSQNGDIFICGSFRGTVDFNPGGSFPNMASSPHQAPFVVKLVDASFNIPERGSGFSKLILYPNPVNDHLNIVTCGNSQLKKLQIQDTNGNLLYEGCFTQSNLIHLNGWPTGMYIISVFIDDFVVQSKVLKR